MLLNQGKKSPVLKALSKSHETVVEILLAYGAEVDLEVIDSIVPPLTSTTSMCRMLRSNFPLIA